MISGLGGSVPVEQRSVQRFDRTAPWQEFLCEEHADLKDEATYEDAKGIRRKRMHAAQPQLGRQAHFRAVRRKSGNRGAELKHS